MNISKQSGMSLWGVSIILIIVIANAFIALKIVPVYMENQTVKTVLESLREPLKQKRLPNKKVRQMIDAKLLVNSIRDIGADKIEIKQSTNKSTVTIDYEVRKNIFYNIDAIMKFKEELEVRRGKTTVF